MFPTASSLSDTFQNKMTTSSHFQNVQHTYCRWNNKKNNLQCYNFLRTYTFSRHSPWHFPSPPGDDVRWLSVASLTEVLVENTGEKINDALEKAGAMCPSLSVAAGGWQLSVSPPVADERPHVPTLCVPNGRHALLGTAAVWPCDNVPSGSSRLNYSLGH